MPKRRERPSWRDYCRYDRRGYEDLTPAELTHSREEELATEMLREAGLLGGSTVEPAYSERDFYARERRREELVERYGLMRYLSDVELAVHQVAWCEAMMWARWLRFDALDIDIMESRRNGVSYRDIADTLSDPRRELLHLDVLEMSPRQIRYRYDYCLRRLMREPLFGLFTIIAIEVGMTTRFVIDACLE